jgi:repressor LexA
MTSGGTAPDPAKLSRRQQHILAAIRDWVERHGYPPTVREIGAAVGLGSPSSVAHHLKALER